MYQQQEEQQAFFPQQGYGAPQEQQAFFPQQAYGASQEQQAFFPQQGYGGEQQDLFQQQAYGSYGSVGGAPPAAQQEPMSKEEKKQVKKDEKEKDKYERLMKLRKKRDEQIARDSKGFIMGFSAVLLILGLLLVLSLAGNAWGFKRFVGTGIGMLTLRTSLLYLEVDLRCEKSFFLEKWLCQKVFINNDINGIHALDDAQAHMCAIPGVGHSACDVMAHAYHANFVIIIAFSLAALCQLFAAFFLWNYFYTLHHPKYRVWASSLTCAGPAIAVFGMCLWTIVFPDLSRIPYSVNVAAETLMGGTGVIGFSDMHGLAFGWSWFAAAFICLLMVLQCLVWYCFFQRQDDEDDIVFQDEQEKEFIANLEAHGYDARYEAPPEIAK